MSENKLAVIDGQSRALMPVMEMEQALERRQAIVDFTKQIMVENTDYGQIPGTGGKPTLLKPGAEKLTTFFGLSPRFIAEEKVTDWTGGEHGGEPFFHFQYRCQLFRGEQLVGEGLGSCNSWEKKYRWRKASRICPECETDNLKRSNYPPRGAPEGTPKGWWCDSRNGGCGEDFYFDDERIQGQDVGRVPNENPADLVNTIDKMAQKRALVAATLIAVNASEFFTQDLEDMDTATVQGDYEEVEEAAATEPAGGNGKPPAKAKERKPDPMEVARKKARRGGKHFVPAVASVTGWEADDIKEAAHTLGMENISGDADKRVTQFETLCEYTELVDSGIEGGLAIAVVNEAITRAEAEAQMAALDAEEEE